MARVKKGVHAKKWFRTVARKTKGFRFGRSTKERQGMEALVHAGSHAFAHRRDKKANFRRLWQVRLNAALREHAVSYSNFMGALKKKNIALDRKVLSQIAANHPDTLKRIIAHAA